MSFGVDWKQLEWQSALLAVRSCAPGRLSGSVDRLSEITHHTGPSLVAVSLYEHQKNAEVASFTQVTLDKVL